MKVSSVNIRIWFAGVAVAAALAPSAAVAQAESLPWQLSQKFPINETDPEASVPSPRERDRNPLEFGYLLQDLIEIGAARIRRNIDIDLR